MASLKYAINKINSADTYVEFSNVLFWFRNLVMRFIPSIICNELITCVWQVVRED